MPDAPRTRIVVAEDDAASRKLLVRQLCDAGYEVIACADGKEALEAIRKQSACIVVADWTMPELDGLELCRTVRALVETETLSFAYFILLTAHREKEEVVAGLEAGADDYLTKPYHKEELLARLRAGERIISLQSVLVQRQIELQKVNRQLTLLNARLEKLARTDELTGLLNRRHFFERLLETWALAARQRQPVAAIAFDLDHFKTINDTYGHAAGDRILRHTAEVARGCLRRYDVLARIGGEEFCIICPGTTLEEGGAVAERFRAALEASVCTLDGMAARVTASIGVAAVTPEPEGDPETLLRMADDLLYRAKKAGRNQVWIADPRGARRLDVAAAVS